MAATSDGGALPSSVWLPGRVGEILVRAAELSSAAIVLPDSSISYRALYSKAALDARSLRRGEIVALPPGDAGAFLTRLWACFLAGAVPIIAPPRFDSPSLEVVAPGTAMLMLTSGSTGTPKVVELTHGNIVASVAASATVNGYRDGDVSLNWLPLWHIGGLMRSIREVYVGCRQVQVPTSSVREDPLRWLDLIDAHRATLAWGPDTAFAAVVAQRHECSARRRWMLDCVRSIYSSGEPVVPATMTAFADMLEPYGFDRGAMRVAWGMTEACFATSSDSPHDAGRPVPGVSMRIVDEGGAPLPEGESGCLEIVGPLVASDGWFRTGDLGTIRSGRLTITGRASDMIKIGGVAWASREIESIVEEIAGTGRVAACGVRGDAGEDLAIFTEASERLLPEIRARVAARCGVLPRFVIPLASDEFPRTDVGKINRRLLRESFSAGAFGSYRRWPFDLKAPPLVERQTVKRGEQKSAESIAAIMSELLRIEVGVDDDLFSSGGTSLRVAQAAVRIGCELADLFRYPTPRTLAAHLAGGRTGPTRPARPAREGVAIVGMACRFPGAPDIESFWGLLCEGRDSLTGFSESELLASGIERRSFEHPSYVRAGMILDDIESFDAGFFGLSQRDAELMDPQQRILLECAWHALEDAGHPVGASAVRVGAWVGARVSEYLLFNLPPPDLFGHDELPAEGFHRLILNDKDYLATRLAHVLDCRGPAITVQTACSSSLVAVHLACRSLEDAECDLAMAGGVSVRVPQNAGYLHTEGMIFSPDGHTRPFDVSAAGTVFGSGVGIVVLKRLADAIRDGDRIYAVVKGSAVNNDGTGPKPTFTSPGHDGQVGVVSAALASANVDPSAITHVEAHGTGTAVGDPLEIAALSEVFRSSAPAICAISSVKSNVGHLVQAGGVAGLIKSALMLHHRVLVPNANYEAPNPLIDFESSPFFVSTETRPWPSGPGPRCAGVSAFGFGGTNAHVILEEATPQVIEPELATGTPRLLPVSAKSPAALRGLLRAYGESNAPLRDLCASAQNLRPHHPHRAAIVASSVEELRETLNGIEVRDVLPGAKPRVGFLFAGQGGQYEGMGRRLYETCPPFRQAVDDHGLGAALFLESVEKTANAQPALVALEIALALLWRTWGIVPDVIIGHSLGEISAAWAAGVISIEDALRFASERGRLMEATEAGAMATVFASPDDFELNRNDVSIAAMNGPQQTVVSGSKIAVEEVVSTVGRRGIESKPVSGAYAFHSALMDPILVGIEREASRMALSPPRIPVISTLTGTHADSSFATPGYWRRQARDPVRFAAAREAARADVVVQIGPGHDEMRRMLATLATLYVNGADVEWTSVESERWTRVDLPRYPFQRKRAWVDLGRRKMFEAHGGERHPLLGERVPSPLPEMQFRSRLDVSVAPYARDHWIYDRRPLVMVGHLEMMRAATGSTGAIVEDVVIEQPLFLDESDRQVQTVLGPDGIVRIFASDDGSTWTLHSTGRARKASLEPRRVDIEEIKARCTQALSSGDVYERKVARGAKVGSGVRHVTRAWRRPGEVIAEVVLLGDEAATVGLYGAHPGLFDSFPQCADLTADDGEPGSSPVLFLPTVVERASFFDRLPARVWTTLRRRDDATNEVYGVDGEIADDDGRVLVALEGFYLKRAPSAALAQGGTTWEVEWTESEERVARVETGRVLVAASGSRAEQLCNEALAVAKMMLQGDEKGPLWIVTTGAQATGREITPVDPEQAALWGFGRSLRKEQPQLRCRLIDLDPSSDCPQDDLRRAMSCAESWDEVAIRRGVALRQVVRRAERPKSIASSYALRLGADRTVEGLALSSVPRREPGPGEVEIEVYYTGLNFRDVLNSTGRIDGPLGYECSGVITRRGPDVDTLEVGSAVMALAMGSFASHVTVDARYVVAKPPNMGFAAAASSLVAYMTAMHALLDTAKVEAGECVLVHTAAGGVGHAAVHVARAIGAKVVASASRPKWPLVHTLGVSRIVDSRVPGFSKDLEPVDVVIDTLGNEFIEDNVAVLRRGGRLVELGHRDVLDLERISKLAAGAGVELINFHIAQDVAPKQIQEMLVRLSSWLADGRARALPLRVFVADDVRAAFETMLRGGHVGKIAVEHPASAKAQFVADPEATYLVTGASGALGGHVARWLADRGACNLALIARRPPSAKFGETVRVRAFAADVADASAMEDVFATILATMPPIRGVVHAAGVIDDGIVPLQDEVRMSRVLSPKIAGARNLDRLTESLHLDFFVLVSSVAGLWGSAGQTGYAAANAFLDQLAFQRRQRGLPATSIDYGAWSGEGMAAHLPQDVLALREKDGAAFLEPAEGVRALEDALAKDRTRIAVFAGSPPRVASPDERPSRMQETAGGAPPSSLEDTINRSRHHVATLLGGTPVDVGRPLPELGLDSLGILLLRGRLIAEFGDAASLPVVRYLERHSLAELAGMIYARCSPPASVPLVCLTALRAEGSQFPIVIVPPAVRTVAMYARLASALDHDHPVYGLNPLGMDDLTQPHESVEDMAACYVSELHARWPGRPCILVGICLGGWVAWEMASRLAAIDQRSRLLVLVDPSPPEVAERPPREYWAHYLVSIGKAVAYHVRHRSLRRWIAGRLRGEPFGVEEALYRIARAHNAAAKRYRARAMEGDVLLLQSSENRGHGERWRQLTRGAFDVVHFPGTRHRDLLTDDAADAVAAAVNARLSSVCP